MNDKTLTQAYFDDLYGRDPDPWRFRTSAYESAKYDDTVAALDERRFVRAVEVGCSIGELTAKLAPWCDELLGIDIAEAPLAVARARNAQSAQVRFERMTLPDTVPEGGFDLIVLSEVLYYFQRDDLARMAAWTRIALRPDGVVLMVHWLGETPDYPLSGDQASEAFIAAARPALTTNRRWRRERYRMDRLIRSAEAGPTAAQPG